MTSPQSKRKSNLWKVFVPLLVIFAFVVGGLWVIQSQLTHPQKSEAMSEIRVGNFLPDFALTRLDGTQVQFSSTHAKVVLINFWATWCEACMDEMPSIVKLREAYKNHGFEVFGINLDESPEAVVPRKIQQLQMAFPVFKDPEGKTADLFDVHAIPLTVILDNQRKILYVKDGEQDWNSPSVHSQVERWLSG